MVVTFLDGTRNSPAMIGFKHETTGKIPSIPRGGKRFIIGEFTNVALG